MITPDDVPLPRYESDPAELRRIFSYFPSGVVALLAMVNGEPEGIVASSFTVGVSIDPPLVSCAVQRTSQTWPKLKTAASIGVSLLAEEHEAVSRQIAGPRDQRFDDVDLREVGSEALFVSGAPVWFECVLSDEVDAGDHTVALLLVERLGGDPGMKPLIFHESGFRQLATPTMTSDGRA